MSEMSNEAIQASIRARGLKVGNAVQAQTSDTAVTGSTPVYVDANGALASGNYPFAVPLFSGVANTANSVISIEGSATGTANDLMHLTLVAGANATATVAGYYRITLTDDAGVITSGAYYAPFYTLS